MSDEVEKKDGGEGAPPADEIKNLKGEMNRKIGSIEENLSKLAKLLEDRQSPAPKSAPKDETSDDDLEDLLYKDPRTYTKKVVEKVRKETRAEFDNIRRAESEVNSTLARLTDDFPELKSPNTELYKQVHEEYQRLPESDKANTRAWESVVYRVASQNGVKPRSKRSEDEAFSVGGGGGGGASSRRGKQPELDPRTVEFARELGLPVEDPKFIDNLKKSSERKNWTTYKTVEKK